MTAFAFYVNSYAAIVSATISFSFLAYYLFINKNYKRLAIDVFIILGLMTVICLIMYGSFEGFINYYVGMFQLAQDNSSAAAYYPYNNWWLLSGFLLIAFTLPFLTKSKSALFYGTLATLSVFAAWKHGMAREDITHAKGFFHYVMIVLVIFILFESKNTFKT